MIDIKDLRKTFRSKDRKTKGAVVEAVRSVNFAVKKGEIWTAGAQWRGQDHDDAHAVHAADAHKRYRNHRRL